LYQGDSPIDSSNAAPERGTRTEPDIGGNIMKKISGFVLAGAAALGLVFSATLADAKGGDRERERCTARASGVGKLHSRWEVKKPSSSRERKRFRAQFEAARTTALSQGAVLGVFVDTGTGWIEVGQMILKTNSVGRLKGKLKFDTQPHAMGDDWKPFPANWPAGVGDGTGVELRLGASSLVGCELS
jgi:hypothetical protein